MSGNVACPRCGQFVDSHARQCQNCGIDLALAAVLAERALTSLSLPAGAPLAPEILVPRLGEYLIEKGLITPEDLQRTLALHQQYIDEGKPKLFGHILLELGLVDRETLDQVVTEQILNLHDALQQANRQLEQRVLERTQELQHALSKLAELNQLKSNFISNISHELRTPLTHLRGYIGLMNDGSLGELSSSQHEAMDVMVRAETRLEQLIDDLIQFSLAARGELTLNLSPVRIEELIEKAVSKSHKIARPRKITIYSKIPQQIPLVRVDGEKIYWVLTQLLDNAIKFTPQGGEITVDAQLESSVVTVGVTDTGIGISTERVAEIFEPFHQLDGSDTRRYGGVGLGLAMVRRIIEAHGSLVSVTSLPGRGSRFEFPLPVSEKPYAHGDN